MRFDWKLFCDTYGIPYVTHGPNTARGNLSIKCPYCGQADPSEHLGLKLDISNPAWACWRNTEHSGRSPRRLVQKLLGCSFEAAHSLINNQLDTAPEDLELEHAVNALRPGIAKAATPTEATSLLPLQMLPEFRPLHQHMSATRYTDMFLNYLAKDPPEGRGFGKDAAAVAEAFKLHYALSGEFAWRLIIPFYVNGVLFGWTGREVRNGTRHRYHSRGSKDIIFNMDAAVAPGVSTLIIVEGPFDAIKLHYYGQRTGYATVATLGVAVTVPQIEQLAKLVSQFKLSIVLLDREMLAAGLPLAAELSAISGHTVRTKFLTTYKDPGEVPPGVVPYLCESLSQF